MRPFGGKFARLGLTCGSSSCLELNTIGGTKMGQPPRVPRVLLTFSALNTNASPNGWIDDGVNELRGNNVDAHLDRVDGLLAVSLAVAAMVEDVCTALKVTPSAVSTSAVPCGPAICPKLPINSAGRI